MGFGDRLKELRDQAQQAVAENKDKIQGAVQVAGEVANTRTGGKYATKIAQVGEKVEQEVEKFAAKDPSDADADADADTHASAASTESGSAAPVPPSNPGAATPGSPPEFE